MARETTATTEQENFTLPALSPSERAMGVVDAQWSMGRAETAQIRRLPMLQAILTHDKRRARVSKTDTARLPSPD